jgi:outer membrane protein assembly factor BamA
MTHHLSCLWWLGRAPLFIAAIGFLHAFSATAGAQGKAPKSTDSPEEQVGLLPEPELMVKAFSFVDQRISGGGEEKDGFYPEFGNMITGAGWISAGPGYRHRVLGGQGVVDVSGALSWNLYKVAQAHFELPHLANDRVIVGSQAMYQDLVRVNYFGLGNDSRRANRSGYRLRDTDVFGYATVKTTPWLSLVGRFGRIHQADLATMGGRHVSYPNTLDIFTDATAPGLARQPAYLHGDISLVADTHNHHGHPTKGGLYRLTAASYADRDFATYSFRRYEAEAAHFVPLAAGRLVIALHAWEVFSDTASGQTVPFYVLPTLGGSNTLRGYDDYRFRDRNMQVLNAESRLALFNHVDAAAFVDAGKVASVASGLDFKNLKRSYGFGLRVHTTASTLARLDVAHGQEGWRVTFKMSDPFQRSSLTSGRSPVIPFVP